MEGLLVWIVERVAKFFRVSTTLRDPPRGELCGGPQAGLCTDLRRLARAGARIARSTVTTYMRGGLDPA